MTRPDDRIYLPHEAPPRLRAAVLGWVALSGGLVLASIALLSILGWW